MQQYKKFGQYLRRYREQAGLGLRETARKAGLSHVYLGQIERGEQRNLSDEKLLSLGRALEHPSVPELFAGAGRVAPRESAVIRQNPDLWSHFILTFEKASLGRLKKLLAAPGAQASTPDLSAEHYLLVLGKPASKGSERKTERKSQV